MLLDRFTDKAIWFGAFDEDVLIGCGRLCGIDENNKFEVENYPITETVSDSLHKEDALEIGKVAVRPEHRHRMILHKKIFLALFEYAQKNHNSLNAFTHNQYIKFLFSQIEFPLKMPEAFKYDDLDPHPVNFYHASYKEGEIAKMIDSIKSKNNNYTGDILKVLEIVAPIMPALMYWHDKNGVVLGLNDICLKEIGGTREQIVGHSPYDFYPKEVAEHILKHNQEVMRTGEVIYQEESINHITTGQLKFFTSIKAPLYDKDGNVIGILGTSIDITAEKEAELLRLEIERYQAEKKAQMRFIDFIGDIQNTIQKYKVEEMNDKLGINSNKIGLHEVIKLTKRQEEILYLLSMNKSPKDIAIANPK